jgi:hypothetical protein
MELSEDETNRLRKAFRKRRSARITLFWLALVFLLVVGIVVLPIMDSLGVPRLVWAPFVYAIMFGVIVAIAFIWRCPACNGLLGDVFTTRYCSKCGLQLQDDTETHT